MIEKLKSKGFTINQQSEDIMEGEFNGTKVNILIGTNNKGIPEEVKNLLTHLRPHWLEGLSVQCYFPWLSGSCIAFNSLQLHSASDFNRQGIIRKLGVSIFTTI